VLFATQPNASGYALYRVPIDGSSAPVALTPIFPSHWVEHVNVTTTGHVIYVRRPFTGTGSELYRVPLDGSSAPELLSDPAPAGGVGNADFASATPAWFSPDQRFVVFLAWKDAAKKAEVFCTEVDGSGPVRKVSAEIVTGGDASSVAFLPGGRRLVYLADQETNNLTNLYMSDYGNPPGRLRPLHPPRSAP
jgi:Tol biopolymer transport system component